MMTYRQKIDEAIQACDSAGIYSGFARFLMVELLRERDLELFVLLDDSIDPSIEEIYTQKMTRILNNEPMGYVLGYEWFYNYKIKVTSDVLIPREETEELVGEILMNMDERYKNPIVADVATGSGAIAVAIKRESNAEVFATDISDEALVIAKENSIYNEAEITFYQGDMLEPLVNNNVKVDVLICNPPYIKNTEHIATSVLEFEPHVALFGGDDGLYFYRKVFDRAQEVVKEKGMLAFEIGFDIGEAVVTLAKKTYPQAEVVLKQDINGLDRMVFVYL